MFSQPFSPKSSSSGGEDTKFRLSNLLLHHYNQSQSQNHQERQMRQEYGSEGTVQQRTPSRHHHHFFSSKHETRFKERTHQRGGFLGFLQSHYHVFHRHTDSTGTSVKERERELTSGDSSVPQSPRGSFISTTNSKSPQRTVHSAYNVTISDFRAHATIGSTRSSGSPKSSGHERSDQAGSASSKNSSSKWGMSAKLAFMNLKKKRPMPLPSHYLSLPVGGSTSSASGLYMLHSEDLSVTEFAKLAGITILSEDDTTDTRTQEEFANGSEGDGQGLGPGLGPGPTFDSGDTVNSDRHPTFNSQASDSSFHRKVNIWEPQFWTMPTVNTSIKRETQQLPVRGPIRVPWIVQTNQHDTFKLGSFVIVGSSPNTFECYKNRIS
ncbi:hypothetical protein BGZ59_006141 [Podila verticillata]|nr:hypothetical protein BGZ59_006141 [Podila verticillata]